MTSTTYAAKARLLVGAVFVAVGVLAGTSAPANALTIHGHPLNASKLVNAFEKHNTFRGVANGNLPRTPSQGFRLGVATVTLPSSRAGITRDGFVDYGQVARNTDLIAASDGPTRDRFALVLENAAAPTRFALNVAVPANSTVVNEPSGAIGIKSSRGNTTLAPATAVDSAGHAVPAHYEIQSGKLVVQVRDKGASFPVMVDPVSSAYWWGTQSWYSRSDVRYAANAYSWIGIAKYACYWMGPLSGLCQQVVGMYTNWISGTWMYAKNTNQCLTMKMLWTGQVIGVNAYACNWG